MTGESTWCDLVAWAALMDLTALLGGSIIISYTTWRLVAGYPVSDRLLILWNLGNWIVAGIVASAFWIEGILGPYKNLYCCVRQDSYRVWASVSTLVFIFATSIICAIFYRKAYDKLVYMEKNLVANKSPAHTKASRIVVQRGTLLVVLTNLWWSLIIVAGIITAAGGVVPASLDMFGAWLVKCMPLFDSYFFYGMLKKVVHKDAKVNPERDSKLAKARNSNSAEIRKGVGSYRSSRHASSLAFWKQSSKRSKSSGKSIKMLNAGADSGPGITASTGRTGPSSGKRLSQSQPGLTGEDDQLPDIPDVEAGTTGPPPSSQPESQNPALSQVIDVVPIPEKLSS